MYINYNARDPPLYDEKHLKEKPKMKGKLHEINI